VIGPLEGIRVIELGTLIAAPFASRLLGEFGAEVIKVESPSGGDPLRQWRKMHGATSLWWYLQSRNKKSIAIDLKAPAGQDLVRRLVEDADVVIENFRPGTLEKWNLGWERLSAINPKLTLVRISGFGQTGPYAKKPGFGAIGEAMGGIRFTTGEPDSPPSRVGVSLGDSVASLHAVIGALMSLYNVKANGGKGQIIDVSLYESVFNLMESLIPEYDLLGHVRERTGGALPGICPSNTYPTKDGSFLVVAGNSDSIFKRLMHAIARSDLAEDPRLASNEGRVANVRLVDGAIAGWTTTLSIDAAIAVLDAAEVPSTRIFSAADIVKDPQYLARDMILPTTLPDGTQVRMPGIAPKMSETPGAIRWVGPTLGEHTRDILGRLGVQEDELQRLKDQKVIG
jgi:crotonobetainyl-CoA:carnitine CoA-transferase CaiB-like acyl-CoA transferase